MLNLSKEAKLSLLKGKKADLPDDKVLKETLEGLNEDPDFKGVTELSIALDNTSDSSALETLSAFLVNVDHPIDIHLSLSRPVTSFQLSYLKKSAELNPYVEAIDIDQKIELPNTKKIWDHVQSVLSRNKTLIAEGFVKSTKLDEIIQLREGIEAQDKSVKHLEFIPRPK